MPNPGLGVPVGPDPRPHQQTREFDHAPKLHELLPNGGWPGVIYAAACIHNMANAAERAERPAHLRPIRGADYFYITGPRGRAQMALVGCGEPIPGASPQGGARLFFTDGEVTRLTGHEVEFPIWFRPQPAASAGAVAGDEVKDGSVQSAPRAEAQPGQQGRSEPANAQQQDRQGPAGRPRPQQPAGGRQGGGNPGA